MSMPQAHFNLEIDSKVYGVLVRQKKYSFRYKIAKNPFKTDNCNMANELIKYFKINQWAKRRFINGMIIEL